MSPPPELRDHLALALVPGLGPKLTRALVDHFGSATAVLSASDAEIERVPQIGSTLAARFAQSFSQIMPRVEAEWAKILEHQVQLDAIGLGSYPHVLSQISDPPTLLYRRGTLRSTDANAVGIVGSRQCTSYGRRITERIASGLALAGWTVISGLARGIDGIAHQAALAAGGRTIAVLAGGLSRIYPPEHAELAERVAEHGALLTETPMTVAPQPGMFPARNRIISGLSRAVVIVEASERSGALITAVHAAEQGRDVYAVPGNVDSPASAGCLDLLRKGARLVRSADDILEDVRALVPPDPPVRTSPTLFDQDSVAPTQPAGLDETQMKIWEALNTVRHGDELARELNLSPSQLAVPLMKLEMKKLIRKLPGGQFERAH
jgi:DNA processing protein